MDDTLPKGGALVAALMRDGPNLKQGYSFANALNVAIERDAPEPCVDALDAAILARDAVLAVLKAHWPSMRNEDEEKIVALAVDLGNTDVADLALRTCACDQPIDGFDGYVDHLQQVFSER